MMMMMMILTFLFVRRNNHLLGINGIATQETLSPTLPEGTDRNTTGVVEFQKVSFIFQDSCMFSLGSNTISTKINF